MPYVFWILVAKICDSLWGHRVHWVKTRCCSLNRELTLYYKGFAHAHAQWKVAWLTPSTFRSASRMVGLTVGRLRISLSLLFICPKYSHEMLHVLLIFVKRSINMHNKTQIITKARYSVFNCKLAFDIFKQNITCISAISTMDLSSVQDACSASQFVFVN